MLISLSISVKISTWLDWLGIRSSGFAGWPIPKIPSLAENWADTQYYQPNANTHMMLPCWRYLIPVIDVDSLESRKGWKAQSGELDNHPTRGSWWMIGVTTDGGYGFTRHRQTIGSCNRSVRTCRCLVAGKPVGCPVRNCERNGDENEANWTRNNGVRALSTPRCPPE